MCTFEDRRGKKCVKETLLIDQMLGGRIPIGNSQSLH